MNHDHDMRRQPKSGIAAYRGNGVCINMLCAKCKLPRPQLGSRKLLWRGVKRSICKQCIEGMGK